MWQMRDARANYGMCFGVLINIPERSLLECLLSKCMLSLIVDININISGANVYDRCGHDIRQFHSSCTACRRTANLPGPD